jgi:hypothetical protein
MLRRNRKPIARVSPKRFKKKGDWHAQRIRATPSEMHELRSQAFARSGGQCECLKVQGGQCGKQVNWFNGDAHHIVKRGQGGSDEIDNLLYCFRDHHERIHGKLQWSAAKRNA